ncbi:MAG: hypothetical protein JRF07_08225 [Deltaproteobacteria bacterium]|nr:hypothetical protein [Deltaproteobacteria bacterium]
MKAENSTSQLDLDAKLLSEFIYALNIARRQVSAYPPGHPVIKNATSKLISTLPKLLEFRNEITIGIARDTLMVGKHVLDSKNPVYRDLAQSLFKSNIAALVIHKDLSEPDITKFFEILHNVEHDSDSANIDSVLSDAGITGIKTHVIDFKNLHATETETVSAPKSDVIKRESSALWKSFVGGLIDGNLDINGDKYSAFADVDPDLLASLLNGDHVAEDGEFEQSYEDAIASFLNRTSHEQIRSKAHNETLGKLGELVGKLKPELRRRFLNSTLRACSKHTDSAEKILTKIPQAAIIDALDKMDPEFMQIPQNLMNVLGKLASSRGNDISHSRVVSTVEKPMDLNAEHLTALFKTDQSQFFVPHDYQDALALLAVAKDDPVLDQKQINDLVCSLDGHSIERQFANVMLDIMNRDPDLRTSKAISCNLEELVGYFLEHGDFESLIGIYGNLRKYTIRNQLTEDSPFREALAVFQDSDFIYQILDGFDTWGKSARPQIVKLIETVGSPFVLPLLDLLADEPDMSRRRLFMECLRRLGDLTRQAILERLHDQRWYFVRNLVILLREMNDPAILTPLGRLVGYAHPKVQYEVMRTFLKFKDPRADRYLLRELESKNPEIKLKAIKLAANSENSDVAKRLAHLLNEKLPMEYDEMLKTAALNSLNESNLSNVLPELSNFLLDRKLFKLNKMTTLKIKALSLIEKMETPEAGEIAAKVYISSSGELARVAGRVCLHINGKLP